ncbi:hypothetical protein E1262_08360 [Jiangella aurantiaca]|uniref:Uncharacterized protein n=1 Tax=Jiangella aurantiaca TaxID=2530373 RepID=A0A4R5AI76_9ACTN|nr:hypothetical protein [Jiangella aurantiaca]TDD70664.1 hypothetical protein E1262_08360 [Jiangella aurantiaca]
MSIDDDNKGATVDDREIEKRLRAVETAQAAGAAALTGAQATQAAAHAGSSATMAAMQAGNMATMVAGGVGFVVGIFLGIAIRSGR